MIAAERRNRIKEKLLHERSVRVSDLVKDFDVSEETVRRDLAVLEQEGFVHKNYGGAILVEELQEMSLGILNVQQRQLQHIDEKDAIGRAAAALVTPNQVVILDAGSTTWCTARHLRGTESLIVVTNGINVAEECSHNPDMELFVLGGKLLPKSMSLVGPQALIELHKYNADFAFIGTTGISAPKGFTSLDIYEAEIKRAMVAASHTVVVLADHSKFEKQSLISFASLEDVDIVITSTLTDPNAVREIESYGVKVMTCEVDSSGAGASRSVPRRGGFLSPAGGRVDVHVEKDGQ